MNRIYKVIWSNVKHCYVVVSEIARNHGKEHSSRKRVSGGVCSTLLALGMVFSAVPLVSAATNSGNPSAGQAVNIENEKKTTATGDDAYATYDSQGNLIVGKSNQVVSIQKDPQTGNSRVDDKPENVALGTRNGVGKFAHSSQTEKPVSGDNSFEYQKLDTEWITVKVYDPDTGTYVDRQVEVYKLTPGQYMDDAYNVRAKYPERSYYSTDDDYRKAVEAYNNVANYYGQDSTRKSYYASGATAVGVDNVAEGDHSTAIGNKAKVLNSVSSYYVDAYGRLTSEQSSARYWLDEQGNITTSPQGYYASDGTFVDRYYTVPRLIDSTDAVALGSDVTAEGRSAVAIGHQSYAKEYSVAIGENSITDYLGVAIGKDNTAKYASVAIGHTNFANGYYTAAMGYGNTARADESTAIGYSNKVDGQQSSSGTPKAYYTHVLGSNNDVRGNSNAVFGDTNTVNGAYAVAVGGHNTISGANNNGTDGEYGIAVGYGNTVGNNALALGKNSNSTHDGSIAIGNSVNTTGDNNNGATNSIAIGTKATVHMKNGIVLGNEAYAGNNGNNSEGAIAIGHQANSAAGESIAIGTKAATGNNAGSTGMQNIGAIAIGSNAKADTVYDIAMGVGASTSNAVNGGAIALGHNATIEQGGQASAAIGDSARVMQNLHDAVALGSQTYADRSANNQGGYDPASNSKSYKAGSDPVWNSTLAAVSVGSTEHYVWDGTQNIHYTQQTRQITNVAAGKEDTDAVNVAQLKQVVSLVNNGGGGGSTGSSIHDYHVNSVAPASDTNYNNTGATGNNALAAGVSAQAKRTDGVAVGTKAAANGERSIAIGSGAYTKDEDAQKDNIAIGTSAYAGGDSSVVIGNGARTDDQKQRAVVLGKGAWGKGDDTIAAGTGAQAAGTYAIALGTGASATSDNDGSVAIGRGAVSTNKSTAVGPNAQTKNESVAMGYNAVTGSQYSVAVGSEAVTGNNDTATAIGYKSNASNQHTTALGAKAKANNKYGVALGYGSVEQGATENDKVKFITINGVQHKFSNAVSQYAVSVGGTTDGTTITRQIKNVANGEVSESSTDAINGSQLYAVAQAITNGGGSSVHYYSVKSSEQGAGSNYDNSGAAGNNALAAGVSAQAAGANATAVGSGAKAWKENAVAIGSGAVADGVGATAIGQYASATGDYALAFGGEHTDATAAAANNRAGGTNAVAFGERTVASGNNSTAFGQETQATEKRATAFGQRTQATQSNATAFGIDTTASGQNATAFGNLTQAANIGATAFGNKNRATGQYATAWGGGDKVVDGVKVGTTASGTYATAFGQRTVASGTSATAFGSDSTASGEDSLAFGENSTAAAKNSLAALGGNVAESAANAAAIGKDAKATLADSVALGSGSVADRQSGAKGYDAAAGKETSETSAAWVSTANAIAVGDVSTTTRQITGVAAGSQDTDAVNLAQLKKVGELTGKHTTVSVGGKSATADDTEVQGGNLELKRHTEGGQANYDVALSKDVVLGVQEEHKGGSLTVNSVAQFRTAPGSKETYPMKEAVKIDGTTVSVVKNDGTNDQRQVVIGIGQDTGGYVALYDNTGKKPTYIFNAISSGITYLKDSASYPADEANEFGRLEYGDIYNGSTQFIATLDDGLKFSGDQGTASAVKLNQKLSVTGGTTDKDNLASAGNIGVVSSQDGDNGKLEIRLNKDLTGLNTVTAGTAKIGHIPDGVLDTTQKGQPTGGHAAAGDYVTGLTNKEWSVKDPTYVSGRAATEDELRIVSDAVSGNTTSIENNTKIINNNTKAIESGLNFTTNTKDAANTTENYKGYKVVKRSLGDTVAIKASDEADGHNYSTANLTTRIADNGDISVLMDEKPTFTTVNTGDVVFAGNPDEKDSDGKAAQADSSVHYGSKTLTDGQNITTADNETKATRLHYKDGQGHTHELATMDDGQIYAGDITSDGRPDENGFARTMNQKTTINGGVKDKDKLTDGNIGVVSNGTDTLSVKLAKDLKDLSSVTTGKTVQDDSGIKITNDAADESKNVVINGDAISFGGNQVTHMGSGSDGKDADGNPTYNTSTNGANIGDVKNIAGSTVDAAKLTGDSNITVTYNDQTADGKNTVKLNDSITLGSDDDKKVAIDGTAGKITAGDKVSLDGNAGKGTVGGVTLGNQTGVATTKTDGGIPKTEDGTFVTGLTNKTWDPDASGIVSGRAATEDERCIIFLDSRK